MAGAGDAAKAGAKAGVKAARLGVKAGGSSFEGSSRARWLRTLLQVKGLVT